MRLAVSRSSRLAPSSRGVTRGQTPGLDPGRADYNSFVAFSDPDGNGWMIQESSSVLQDGDGIHRQIRLREHLGPPVFPALQVDYDVALRLGATD